MPHHPGGHGTPTPPPSVGVVITREYIDSKFSDIIRRVNLLMLDSVDVANFLSLYTDAQLQGFPSTSNPAKPYTTAEVGLIRAAQIHLTQTFAAYNIQPGKSDCDRVRGIGL